MDRETRVKQQPRKRDIRLKRRLENKGSHLEALFCEPLFHNSKVFKADFSLSASEIRHPCIHVNVNDRGDHKVLLVLRRVHKDEFNGL
jgi:hypothetical protein